jgi:hypothetical protein
MPEKFLYFSKGTNSSSIPILTKNFSSDSFMSAYWSKRNLSCFAGTMLARSSSVPASQSMRRMSAARLYFSLFGKLRNTT